MKQIVAMIMVIALIGCLGMAEVVRTDDAVVFLNAIDLLKQTKSRQSVAESQEMLESINSNYNQANIFGIYASAIIDIFDDNFDDAQNKLIVLELNNGFANLLKKFGLPDCSVLDNYMLARQAEAEGRYSDALELYTSMNFMDSLERSVNLVGWIKEQQYRAAEALFEQGLFVEAAEAFEALGQYKDSAARVAESLVRVTPEPTPSPTPTPRPTSKPTPKYYAPSQWGDFHVTPVEGYTGNFGQEVGFCLSSYFEFTENIGKPEVLNVSWMDISQYKEIEIYFYTKGKYDDFIDEMLKSAREGRLLFASQYVTDAYGPRWYFDMALPDDPAIAGIQSIKVKMGDQIIIYSGKLTYDGDYTTGNGWQPSDDWTIAEISGAIFNTESTTNP